MSAPEAEVAETIDLNSRWSRFCDRRFEKNSTFKFVQIGERDEDNRGSHHIVLHVSKDADGWFFVAELRLNLVYGSRFVSRHSSYDLKSMRAAKKAAEKLAAKIAAEIC
jgi:hypothetical protein